MTRVKIGEHYVEYRRVDIFDDGSIEIENPSPEEYNLRLIIANKYHRKDKNSIGHCWMRAHCKRNGLPDLC
jgi:hypothetical protein